MEETMKSRLIIAVGLALMVGACVAGPYGGAPDGGKPAYFNSGSDRNSGYYDSTYYKAVTTTTASRTGYPHSI
jgi:hypothetical protein